MSGKRTGRRMERTGKHRGASDGGPVPIPLNGYKIHNSWCVCLCTLWLQYDLLLSAPDGNIEMLAEAKETFLEDPLTQNDFFIGNGMLTIEFA